MTALEKRSVLSSQELESKSRFRANLRASAVLLGFLSLACGRTVPSGSRESEKVDPAENTEGPASDSENDVSSTNQHPPSWMDEDWGSLDDGDERSEDDGNRHDPDDDECWRINDYPGNECDDGNTIWGDGCTCGRISGTVFWRKEIDGVEDLRAFDLSWYFGTEQSPLENVPLTVAPPEEIWLVGRHVSEEDERSGWVGRLDQFGDLLMESILSPEEFLDSPEDWEISLNSVAEIYGGDIVIGGSLQSATTNEAAIWRISHKGEVRDFLSSKNAEQWKDVLFFDRETLLLLGEQSAPNGKKKMVLQALDSSLQTRWSYTHESEVENVVGHQIQRNHVNPSVIILGDIQAQDSTDNFAARPWIGEIEIEGPTLLRESSLDLEEFESSISRFQPSSFQQIENLGLIVSGTIQFSEDENGAPASKIAFFQEQEGTWQRIGQASTETPSNKIVTACENRDPREHGYHMGMGFAFAGVSESISGQRDMFVGRLSPAGEMLWTKQYSNGSPISFDETKAIVTTFGYTHLSTYLIGETKDSSGGPSKGFVMSIVP